MYDGLAAIPPLLAALWVGVVGACIGSFLNVVIARVPAGESLVRPGSRCPRCRTPIHWYDNVPVVSWLVLRARCRACGEPISARYPVVEAAVAVAALGAWARHGLSLAALAELALVAFLVALAAIDLDTWLLPNALTWPLIGLGLLAGAAGLSAAPSLRSSAVGAALGLAAFAAVAWVGRKLAGREALGTGDIWLLAALGAWLGVAALLPVVLLASTQGALVGLALLALGKGQTGERPAPSPPVETVEAGAEEAGCGPGVDEVAERPAEVPAEAVQVSAEAAPDEEQPWVPPRNAVPFGPFLALAALEWLYLGAHVVRVLPALRIFR